MTDRGKEVSLGGRGRERREEQRGRDPTGASSNDKRQVCVYEERSSPSINIKNRCKGRPGQVVKTSHLRIYSLNLTWCAKEVHNLTYFFD